MCICCICLCSVSFTVKKKKKRKDKMKIIKYPEVKASACNTGDLGSIPGLGRSPGEENGNPLQYSRLEDPMDRGASWATVNGVTNSQTLLCLQSKSPQLRKQDIHGNANAKREFIASSSQGPGHIQHSGIEPEPRALDYSSIYRFRTKTGNWQG